MKKVLILTVTAGNGHNAAAYAIKNRLEKEEGQFEIKIVDLLKECSSSLNNWIVDRGYALSVKYCLPVYNFFWRKYSKRDASKANCAPAQTTVDHVNGKLLKIIYNFQPDVIYCTHFYCGMALANLKRVYNLPSKNIASMLDYDISPFWECTVGGIDYLTLSNEDFRGRFIERGFSTENLVCTGIPVDTKFLLETSKKDACEKLGLKQDIFTVLVFFGSGSWGGAYRVVRSIVDNFKDKIQIIVVNGRDEHTKEKIDEEMKNYPENIILKNFGFSNEIDLLMSASDIMIGKGGGLCVTETIIKTLPLLATQDLPSQELYNIEYLKSKGLAMSYGNKKEMIKLLQYANNNRNVLGKMKEGLKTLRMNGIEEIFKLINDQPLADYALINTHIDYDKVNSIVKRARKRESK